MPSLRLTVNEVWVVGGLRKATVIVTWTAEATLLDGSPYANRGVHIITLLNRKIASIDVAEDSQAVVAGLRLQAAAGITEALEAPITS